MKKKLLVIIVGFSLFVWYLLYQSIDLTIGQDHDYPNKPINFLISTGAGGTTDLAYRAFIDAANKYLKQPMVPINKVGAGGVIAAMAIKTAKPDGYTLGGATPSNVFVAPFAKDAPYRDLDGFTFINNYTKYAHAVMVRSDAPWKTWKEFIEWARQNPGGAKIGIFGAKTVATQGLALSRVEKEEKVKFTFVSFNSLPEILTATLGGHINVYGSAGNHPTVVEYIKEGKMRVLAYLDLRLPLPGSENYPSLQELYRWESSPNIHGIWGPKGLPNSIVNKLEEVSTRVIKDPDFLKSMNNLYMPVVYMNKSEMEKYVDKTMKEMEIIMKELRAD